MADFMRFPTARERVLTSGNTTVGIIPDICLVSHFQVGEWRVLYRPAETGNVKRWGLPLMIPNFSRLKDGVFQDKGTSLPIHGFGRNLPWTVVEQTTEALTMQLFSSEATRPDYPYEFVFTVRIAVAEETLTYTLTMENHSQEVMPIAPGFHPYFTIAQAEKVQLVTDGPPGFAVGAFDWETTPPDNAYPFAHQLTARFPGRGTLNMAEVPQDGVYALRNLQVWSEPAFKPDHDFVCFEPTVGSEDALNRPKDRLEVAPGGAQRIVLEMKASAV